MKNSLIRLLLALSTALLLSLAWPPGSGVPLILVAFIPLLWLEKLFHDQPMRFGAAKFWAYAYVSMLVWNVLTTYWIYYAGAEGSYPAFIANALLMSLVWLFFHKAHRWWGGQMAYFLLCCCWVFFEWFHLNWDLAWPWLTLGNAFASLPQCVQWYSLTGHLGGSWWIVASNVMAFRLFMVLKANNWRWKQEIRRPLIFFLTVLIIPVGFSLMQWYTWKPNEHAPKISALVIQPNIDPYTEKFGELSPDEQLQKMLRMANEACDTSIRLVVFPETALVDNYAFDELASSEGVGALQQFIAQHPHAAVVIGANVYKVFREGKNEIPITARPHGEGIFVDFYNAALFLQEKDGIGFYAKSKLVPGVEKMPFPHLFGFLEKYALDLGGTSGSLGVQDSVCIFRSHEVPAVFAAPVICYESVFGGYCTEYSRKGANIFCIITNDGWWRDSPGYKQHLQYARLRAIENNRQIVRSANTGISAFINERGEITESTKWWEPAVIQSMVRLNSELTFYATWGDYPGFLALIFLVIGIAKAQFFKKQRSIKPDLSA